LPFASAVVEALAAPLNVTVDPEPALAGVRVPEIVAVTVSNNDPVAVPCVAEIVDWPTATPVATPVELTLAAAAFDDAQVAELVRFCVVPSLYIPVAVNCSFALRDMEALGAVIAIDCSVGAVMVSATMLEVTPFCVAMMLLEPTPVPVARPTALIVAAAAFDELQVAELVKFWVVPSLNLPVAVN
jgi:hypothetical protein